MTESRDEESLSVDEARLLARLGEMLGSDPPPAGMQQRLQALLTLRDMDRELLELLQQSTAEPAGMRGEVDTADRLAFVLADGSVSLELVVEHDGLRGQVLAGEVTDVTLERPAAELRTTTVDALGRFVLDQPGPGPARLRLRLRDARSVTTNWFLV